MVARHAFVAALLLSAAFDSDAQQAIVITDDAACRDCRMELDHVASLGAFDGPGELPGMIASVAQDSEGRFYVTTHPGTEVHVFSATGAFIRSLGASGAGPGEFRRLLKVIVGPDDSLFLADAGLWRITVMNRDGNLIRFANEIRPSISMLRLPDGMFVVNTDYLDRDRIGYPLHLHHADGSYVRPFGEVVPAYSPDMLSARRLAVSPFGTVWSAHPQHYHLEEWDVLNGRRLRFLERRADWFSVGRMLPPTPSRPPEPRVVGIHEDESNRLWTIANVSAPDWAGGLGPPEVLPGSPSGQQHYPTIDFDRLFDTIIEVIDPDSGRLVTSQRFSPYIMHFLNDSTVAGPRISEFGDQRVEVWRVRLVHGGQS